MSDEDRDPLLEVTTSRWHRKSSVICFLYGTLSRISYFLLSVEEQVNFKLKRPNQLTILTAGGAGCRLQSRTDALHDEISFICLVVGGVLLHNDFDSTFRLYYDAK